MSSVRERYGESFWRAHHEAWLQSELNQREYCEAYGVPRQLASKVQSRTTDAGAQSALPTAHP
jgi:hypothetical protein